MSLIKTHLMSWATGRGFGDLVGETTRTLVLDDSSLFDDVMATPLGAGAGVVMVPRDPQISLSDRIVGYEGGLTEPGEEFSHSPEFFLQIQGYGVSEYMSVVGPTVVRVADAADFEAYLRDADRALATGHFPDFLTKPQVQLADLPALGAPDTGDGPARRLHVRADGSISTSPTGTVLGSVGDDVEQLQQNHAAINEASRHACAVCLAEAVPADVREDALQARPWLGRFLAAVQGVRDLSGRGVPIVGVSGFGARLVATDGIGPDEARTDLPVLLWSDLQMYAHLAGSGRTFQLDRPAAEALELLTVHGSVESASAHGDSEKIQQVAATFDQVEQVTA